MMMVLADDDDDDDRGTGYLHAMLIMVFADDDDDDDKYACMAYLNWISSNDLNNKVCRTSDQRNAYEICQHS